MLDRKDIEQLEGALKQGLTLVSAKEILARNELTNELNIVGQELSYKFGQVVRDKIEEIEKIESDEERVQFITQESYKIFVNEKKQRDEQNKKFKLEEKERQERQENTVQKVESVSKKV